MSKVLTLSVPDISCEGCAKSIKAVLGTLPGIGDVQVDVPAKSVTLRYCEQVTRDAITQALDEAGFPAS